MSDIVTNLRDVRANIEAACKRAGRSADEVTLIAVSKTKGADLIREAYDAGVRDFGENRVQEILAKKDILPQDIRWHMIGHLQRNKVRQVIDKVVMIHSVDSYELAKEISVQAVKRSLTMRVLLEVNIASEESKFGLAPADVAALAEEVSRLDNIRLEGLMCVAPMTETPEDNREYFRRMREILIDTNSKSVHNISMQFLSMGMTLDYQIAVEEGASMVRVGTAVFGQRSYVV